MSVIAVMPVLAGTAAATGHGSSVTAAPGTLTLRWWQEVLAIPSADTLDRCDLGTPTVAFLAGTGGGAVERSCTISRKKAILVPLINVECSTIEGDGPSPGDLRTCTAGFADFFTDLSLVIDGNPVPNVGDFRVTSRPFILLTAKGNAFGIDPGIGLAVSDGYWALIPPLSRGEHTVSFGGSFPPGTFTTQATYHLTVV